MSQRQKTLGTTKRGRKPRGRAAVEPPPTEEDTQQDTQEDTQEDTQPEDTQQDTQQESPTNSDSRDDVSVKIAEEGGAKKRGKVTREPKVQINDPKAEEAMIEWVKETRLLWDKTCPEYRMTKHEQKLVVWEGKAPELAPDQILTGKLFHFF